jgi:predicted nucleic acid-binding protein
MPAKVVDASVIAAIVFGEPEADTARALISGAELYAPSLLAYELAGVARNKVLKYPEQRNSLLRGLEIALSLEIHWVDVEQAAVVRLALETGLTTYDATYLYLARTLNIPLETFDQHLQTVIRQNQ